MTCPCLLFGPSKPALPWMTIPWKGTLQRKWIQGVRTITHLAPQVSSALATHSAFQHEHGSLRWPTSCPLPSPCPAALLPCPALPTLVLCPGAASYWGMWGSCPPVVVQPLLVLVGPQDSWKRCRRADSAAECPSLFNLREPVSSPPFPFISWRTDSWRDRKRWGSGWRRRSQAVVKVKAAWLWAIRLAATPKPPTPHGLGKIILPPVY